MIQLLASDVDGTLLGADDRPSRRTVAALAAARDAGWVVVLATGRPPRILDPAVADLGVDSLAICNNGATLYDPAARRVVHEIGIPEAVTLDVVARLREAVDGLVLALDWGLELAADARFAEGTLWRIPPGARIGPVEEAVTGPVAKVLARSALLSSDALAERVRPLLSDEAEVTSSTGSGVIEITAPGISKGTALAAFAAARGIGREAVVAFGDMPNDTEMLRWAGLGVAMGNGHPSVLAVADEVAASNIDDGVARVVERLLADRLRPERVA